MECAVHFIYFWEEASCQIGRNRDNVLRFNLSWQEPIFSAVKTVINLRMFIVFLRK